MQKCLRFVGDPTVEREFWENERVQMALDCGPCESICHFLSLSNPSEGPSARVYVEAIAHCEIGWIEQCAKPKVLSVPLSTSAAQKLPDAHIDLLPKYLCVAPKLLPIENDLLLPTLWHRDLHRGNVFIHEGEVSSIID